MLSRHRGAYRAAARGGVIALAILLYRPSPSFGEAQRPDQPPSADNKTEPGQNGRTAQILPPVKLVKTFQTPHATSDTSKNAKNTNNKSSADWWMVCLTFILSVAAVIQCEIFILQIFTTRSQLRAYVFIEKIKIKRRALSNNWDIMYTVKNNGVTPAHRVHIWATSSAFDGNTDFLFLIPNSPAYESLGSIAPHGDFIDNDESVESVSVADLKSGKRAIFLWGRILYKDVFRCSRRTDFCYFVGGESGLDGDEMFAYDKGNDST